MLQFNRQLPLLFFSASLLMACSSFSDSKAQRDPRAPGFDSPPLSISTPNNTGGPAIRRKLALLVGINKYQYPDTVPTLAGCVNDVEAMRSALVSPRYGFKAEEIVMLIDEKATRASIIKNFEDHLIAKAGPADIVIFHYSGHGSRMRNPGDASGYDNTLVPYDSRDPDNKITDIRDKEINALLRRLAKKTGNTSFISDSCYSGTIDRAAGAARRAPDDKRFGSSPPAPETFGEQSNAREANSGSGLAEQDSKYVLIAGSRTDQVAFEIQKGGKEYGALTYYLVRELLKPSAIKRTYRDLMSRVISSVSSEFPNQIPQLEGKAVDQTIFGDETIKTFSYVPANPVNGNQVELSGGRLHGFTVGSVFDLYSPEAHTFQQPEKPVAQMKLVNVDALKSVGQITKGRQIPAFSKAIESEHNFEAQKIRVYYENLAGSPALKRIKTVLDAHPGRPFQTIAEARGFQIRLQEDNGALRTFGSDGHELSAGVSANNPNLIDLMERRLLDWGRWFNLLGIQNPGSSVAVEFSLTPRGANTRMLPGQIATFTPGDSRYDLKVKNLADRKLFIYILDITSAGKVKQVYPEEGSHIPLSPDQELPIPDWNVALPGESPDYVRDVFKLIAVSNQVDLTYLQQGTPRGRDSAQTWTPKPSDDPLSRLLFEAAMGKRDASRRVPTDWTTADIVFEVCKEIGRNGRCNPR